MSAIKTTDVDRLYQLPLEEFTAARNALAKGAANAAEIRALAKPPIAAWAVNQLYWKDRRTWDVLIDASENLRRVNKAVLAGRSGDVRAAGAAHDAALRDALKATLEQLAAGGHPVTDATRQAILTTLRALPADDPPGRLARVLQPGAFEMLAGLTVAAPARKETEGTKGEQGRTKEGTKGTKGANGAKGAKGAHAKSDVRALTRAREAAAAADRVLKEAEQAVRRHEFEIARAARDEERAARAVEAARVALEEAKAAAASAGRDQSDARSRRAEAESASKKGAAAVAAARQHAEAARAALKKVQGA